MSISQFPKSPNKFHPTTPSAVGSRESIAQEGRDKVAEADVILNETYDKVLNHIQNKLPEEVLKELDINVNGYNVCTTHHDNIAK